MLKLIILFMCLVVINCNQQHYHDLDHDYDDNKPILQPVPEPEHQSELQPEPNINKIEPVNKREKPDKEYEERENLRKPLNCEETEETPAFEVPNNPIPLAIPPPQTEEQEEEYIITIKKKQRAPDEKKESLLNLYTFKVLKNKMIKDIEENDEKSKTIFPEPLLPTLPTLSLKTIIPYTKIFKDFKED